MILFFALSLALTNPAHAGFGVDYKAEDDLLTRPLPERPEPPVRTCGFRGGISDASVVARDTALLKAKFERIPLDKVKTCRLGDESIAVQRYAETSNHVVLVTRVNGGQRLIYDPNIGSQNNLVRPDMSTWGTTCPVSTVEWLMEEQLERVFACYPEAGYTVTSKKEDEAARKAHEEAQQRLLTTPQKNPGL